jgi:sugar (pentulose or hexulose) kinase
MRCLGIDIGSSSIKGAILNLQSGQVERIAREPFPDPLPGLPQGFHEVDPAQVLSRTISVIRQLLAEATNVRSIFFCGQMGGVILTDATARPVTNYLSWRDQRSLLPLEGGKTPLLDEIEQRLSPALFADLGRELKPGTATVLLHWLVRHKQLPSGAIPASIGDFVVGNLCNIVPTMHRTHTIGMLNLRTNDWHRDAFQVLGLDLLHWPTPADDQKPLGRCTIDGRDLEVYTVMGDQQAALKGIQLTKEELSINVSTGSQVSQITSDFQPSRCQTRCWFGTDYLNTITHIPAGRSLTVIEALLTELPRAAGINVPNSWKLISEATERANGDGLSCDLSFFASAMGNNGRIDHITTENLTVGNLFQSAFEFMADSYLTCSQRLSDSPTWSRIAISGGLVQAFPSLRQKLQKRFSLPMREVAEQEETMMGLLYWAREIESL